MSKKKPAKKKKTAEKKTKQGLSNSAPVECRPPYTRWKVL